MTIPDGIFTNELERVERGPKPDEERYGYFIVPVDADCPSNADVVLERCREVMRAVLTQPEDPWPSIEQWRSILPRWFVEAGGEEDLPEDAEKISEELRGMTSEELERLPWPAGAWVNTFQDGRSWFWWDAKVPTPDHLQVKLAVEGHPWSEGAIRWLLLAAGSTRVSFE